MKYLLLLLFIVSVPCFSQETSQYHACLHSAHTQLQLNACASQEATRADVVLNYAYHKLLTKTAAEPEAIAKIKAAEEAWIRYRDAYIDAMFPAQDKQAEYGSLYPQEANLLKAKITRQQTMAIGELLQQYSSGSQ